MRIYLTQCIAVPGSGIVTDTGGTWVPSARSNEGLTIGELVVDQVTAVDGNDAAEPQEVTPTAATDTVEPTVFGEVEVEPLKGGGASTACSRHTTAWMTPTN